MLRGCLFALAAIVGIAVIVVWFFLPTAAAVAITGGLVTAGFNPANTQVEVVANPPLELLSGRADVIRIRSTDLTIATFHASTLDLTLRDARLLDRSFVSIDGTLGSVKIPLSATGTGTVTTPEVRIAGPARAATCSFEILQAELTALVRSATADRFGIAIGDVTLAPPTMLRISVGPLGVNATVIVDPNGSLLLNPDFAGVGPITLYAPAAGDPFHLATATVTSTGLLLSGTFDATAALQ